MTGRFPPRPGTIGIAALTLIAVSSALIVRSTLRRDTEPSAESPFTTVSTPAGLFDEPQAEATGHAPAVALQSATAAGVTVTARAVASPAIPGARVVLQAHDGARWRTVAAATQDAAGAATFLWRVDRFGALRLRAASPTDELGDARYSAERSIVLVAAGARVVRWREWVEPGIEGRDEFVATIGRVLSDPRGWAGTGRVVFRYTPSGPVSMVARLARPATTDRLCYPADTRRKWSCRNGSGIVVNSDRWFDGSPTLDMPVPRYREMVINHEVGHVLGFGHASCPGKGAIAPVMMQQSKGLRGCRWNPWPTASELRRL